MKCWRTGAIAMQRHVGVGSDSASRKPGRPASVSSSHARPMAFLAGTVYVRRLSPSVFTSLQEDHSLGLHEIPCAQLVQINT